MATRTFRGKCCLFLLLLFGVVPCGWAEDLYFAENLLPDGLTTIKTEGPVVGKDGLFIKKKFAAVAVMEKRSDWGADYAADERAGDWGFALYDTKGMPKENSLDCATCHQPLTATNFMFTFLKLKEKQ